MKIAVLTKSTMVTAPERKSILSAVYAEKDFYVTEFNQASQIGGGFDRILSFGGDGTMLEAAVKAAETGAHVLGINLGNMGFLTALERGVAPDLVVRALKSGRFTEKVLLEANVAGEVKRALNDVVIKSASTRPIKMSLYVDGNFVDFYHSDGLIVSTQSGSTAYALSAGGPVIAPEVEAFVIIPICAHSLHSRPLVISAGSRIVIKVEDKDCAIIVVDGDKLAPEGGFTEVNVNKADRRAKFTAADGDGFYKKLLLKMNRWGVTDID